MLVVSEITWLITLLHPAGVLLREERNAQSTQLNATRENLITTPNICTVQGLRGRDGRDGLQGRDGRDGVPGSKGERGDTGLQGPLGPQGSYALQFIIQFIRVKMIAVASTAGML